MSSHYEWVDVPDHAAGQIMSAAEMRAEADDDGGLTGDVVGVCATTGSDGAILWGPRETVIAWAADVVRRLRNGEGAESAEDDGDE
jgi:hypothetical protein